MKILFRALGSAGVLCVMSLWAAAQNPSVSTKYSDEQIEELIQRYQQADARDVFPEEALSQQLKKDFPAARDIEWETAAGIYKAEFEIKQKDYDACYDDAGNLLMYAFDVRLSEVPESVKNAAKAKYPKFKLDRDAKKIIRGKTTFYEVTAEKGETEIEALFDNTGRFVNN
jgi:L-2-hydroxyglutarate oxidase LhgO